MMSNYPVRYSAILGLITGKLNRIFMRMLYFTLVATGTTATAQNRAPGLKTSVYYVHGVKRAMKIDGNWNKPQWRQVKAVEMDKYMGDIPEFHPVAQAKMMYSDSGLYVIFRVQDRYIRCVTREYNGPVCKDACVEFFFSPDIHFPDRYFNLEINCGGTMLMGYVIPQKGYKHMNVDDIKKIEIAHSLPQIVDPEIAAPVVWTIECRIPLELLAKYATVTHPKAGVAWRANFYKTASNSSNPHWITWSFVDSKTPDFHLPQCFGTLRFE
jgi:hypothetical protein